MHPESVGPFDVEPTLAIQMQVPGGKIIHRSDATGVRGSAGSRTAAPRTLPGMNDEHASAGGRLRARLNTAAAPVCVGLDPVADRLPPELADVDPVLAIEAFSRGVLAAVEGIVPCVKVQSACFERYGHRGVAALERVIATATEAGFETILDAKRGDIGVSARHYAVSAAETGCGWITLNGYLGEDGLLPFLEQGLGIFVLVQTSNPSGDEIQSTACGEGTVASLVGRMVHRLGGTSDSGTLASVGAVVGATKPEAAAALRRVMPRTPFLLPGYGAQGGGADGVRAALDGRGGGVLVTASRSIIHAWYGREDSIGWEEAVSEAATAFVDEVATVVSERVA